jgi:hypothetical protein
MNARIRRGMFWLMAWLFFTGNIAFSMDIQFEVANRFSEQPQNRSEIASSVRANNQVRTVAYDEEVIIDNVQPNRGSLVQPTRSRFNEGTVIDNATPRNRGA